MKKLFLFLSLISINFSVYASFESDLLAGANCNANCTYITEVNGQDYVVALDENGTILEATSIDLEGGAFTGSTQTTDTTPSGNETESLTSTFETLDSIIVIVIIKIYDSNGNLVDVDVHKFKVPLPPIPSAPTEDPK